MDMKIIRLPSGGLVEKLGRGVRLTTPCAGALASDSRTRLAWQMLTVQQAEQALGFRLQIVEWTLTAVGARTIAYPETSRASPTSTPQARRRSARAQAGFACRSERGGYGNL